MAPAAGRDGSSLRSAGSGPVTGHLTVSDQTQAESGLPPEAGRRVDDLLVVDRVSKRFGSSDVLRDISLTVKRGEVFCVLGSSGGGKSTLLRCISHLETVDAGRILVDGEYVGYREVGEHLHELPEPLLRQRRAQLGMVFQNFNLFPHMTAIANVTLAPMMVKGETRAAARERALQLLDGMGLSEKADSYPGQLSGGQQQRVAIARALAMQPKLMLFDEPTSALDPELVGEVLSSIRELAAEGMTMVIVTHEIGFAKEVGDKVAFIHEGRVLETGSAREVLEDPKTERAQAFLRRSR